MKTKSFCAALAVALFATLSPAALAKSGDVIIEEGVLLWGQYKQRKNVIALEPPVAPGLPALPQLLKDYPVSGAGAGVIRCQAEGPKLFAPDGSIASMERLESIRRDVEAVYSLDMLPIVVLFEPKTELLLESKEAYIRAAKNVYDALIHDYYFLVCITDQGDSKDWQVPSEQALADILEIGRAIRELNETQIVAAGGASDAFNVGLITGDAPVQVIMRRVPSLSPGAKRDWRSFDVPVIDVVRGSVGGDPVILKPAIESTLEAETYGFSLDFSGGAGLSAHNDFLANAANLIDAAQKLTTKATPPTAGDTHSLKPGEAEDGFVSLFDGKSLAGWVPLTVPDDFVVEDGAIRLDKGIGGWLRSWEAYGDFIYRGEYKIEEGGNAGFYIRAPLLGRQSRVGFEFQIRGQQPADEIDISTTGSIYDVKAPTSNEIKPGEWNELEVQCIGTHVKITWNGKVVHDFRYEEVDKMKIRATRGYIGLQDHHDDVRYRNLRIKRLD